MVELKDIIPHINMYSETAKHDMKLCLEYGQKEKEQYAKEKVLEEKKKIFNLFYPYKKTPSDFDWLVSIIIKELEKSKEINPASNLSNINSHVQTISNKIIRYLLNDEDLKEYRKEFFGKELESEVNK